MTTFTTQTLVPALEYTGANTYVGTAVPAANYYGGQGAIQTIVFDVDAFQGNISIEATLNDLQESAPWFEIANIGNDGNTITGTSSTTVIGNFTWLRAVITDFAAGNVKTVTASY